jgi:hypothetical protein
MWVLPPDVGPKYTSSIKDVCSFRNVGIGADILSGRGSLKCDGAISPDERVMGAIESGRALTAYQLSHSGGIKTRTFW